MPYHNPLNPGPLDTLAMILITLLTAYIFVGCGSFTEGGGENTCVVQTIINGQVICQGQDVVAVQDQGSGQDDLDDEHKRICCECFTSDTDGLTSEQCQEINFCSELYGEVELDQEKRQIVCGPDPEATPPPIF